MPTSSGKVHSSPTGYGPARVTGAGLRGGVAAGEVAGAGQGPLADLVSLAGRDAEHAEQALGNLVGGLRAVAVSWSSTAANRPRASSTAARNLK